MLARWGDIAFTIAVFSNGQTGGTTMAPRKRRSVYRQDHKVREVGFRYVTETDIWGVISRIHFP